jgi:hypothetical protein
LADGVLKVFFVQLLSKEVASTINIIEINTNKNSFIYISKEVVKGIVIKEKNENNITIDLEVNISK